MQEHAIEAYENAMKNIFGAALERLKKLVPDNGEIILSYAEMEAFGYTPSMGKEFEDLRDMAYARNNEFGFLSQCIVFDDIIDMPSKKSFVFKFTKDFTDAVVRKLPAK